MTICDILFQVMKIIAVLSSLARMNLFSDGYRFMKENRIRLASVGASIKLERKNLPARPAGGPAGNLPDGSQGQGKRIADYYQESINRFGTEQFKKLMEKGLRIPVVLL